MATPTTYGSRDKNPFRIPETYNINGKPVQSNIGNSRYYLLVDSVTGDTTIKSPRVTGAIGGADLDRTVGVIPKDGTFKPNLDAADGNEIKYFSSVDGQKSTKNHAVITAQKAGAQNGQQLIFPNTALPGAGQGQNQPPQGGDASPGTPSAPSNTIDDFLKSVAGGDIRTPDKYPNLKYPELMDPTQDCITFTMIEYVPKKVNTNVLGNLQNFGGDQIFTKPDGTSAVSGGTVTLPIQPTITDSNSVQWNDSTMNAMQAGAAGGALGLMTNAPQTDSIATDDTKGANADSVKKLVGYSLAEKAAGGEGGGLFTRATGAIVNPNLELLFEGPTLRNFSFTFTMSARQPSEAIIIKKIIRFFKQGMSVKRAQSALFLKSPHVFRIKYLYQGNKDHPWINKIKECALTSCSVNYTPSGSYATFEDGAMTQYDLSLSFTELEPIYDDDYPKDNDATIGY